MNGPWQDPRVERGMTALLKLRRERITAGDRAIGWKVAFGAPAVQEKLGISAPLVGCLFESRALRSGEAASLAGWAKPIAEPEIAVRMGRDLAAGADLAAAAAAIASYGAAIELIDSPQPPEDPERVLAGNIAHRHVVLGAAGAGEPERMSARIFRRGAQFARTGDVRALPGDPRQLIAYVADYLAAFGEQLRAGEVVICGSVVAPIPIEPDEDSFGYALDPIGEVVVRFERRTAS